MCIRKEDKLVYGGAESALPTMMDEYTKERERAGILDNKAIALITMLLALLTVYIPVIPFNEMKELLKTSTRIQHTMVVITLILLSIALVMAGITFFELINTIKLQAYTKVDIDKVCQDDYLKSPKAVMEYALCDHYKEIIHHNSEINDTKANRIKCCFTWITVTFFLLLISTLILKLI